ncbi:putative short-chain dehydrogenase [Caballeronia novacaledonica]|uniref:Putative short-chain dehydrogenase n=1 Tax=Caballeronia novacaledonica TaxID=1544861 RepID=A0A2U3I3Z4_9BURK|nr:SDR family oxidoreductase [Caballeronia novacaledonica]SPB14840.1 putative short-chain dehydrogenase [Caballeronia novacaledonica]
MNQQTSVHAPDDSGVPESARDFSVKERVVIITGAGQGIGREYARQFAAAGAIPVVADLNVENAKRVCAEIERAGGLSMPVSVDVGDRESVDAMVESALNKYGRVDTLINNAAIFATLPKRPFDEIPLDEWERVMRINITGAFLCARAVAPAMRKANWGRIINTSSDSVPRGVANYLHYVTSKSAIIGMTNSLARELGPFGITVNAIRPGAVATEVDRAVNPTQERRVQLLSEQCLRKGQLPTDLVGLAIFLSTNASAFITGQTIACDGGYTHSN